MLLDLGQFSEARQWYEEALKKSPGNRIAKRGKKWAEDLIEVTESPLDLPDKILQTYAGEYGSRRVTLREGILYYKRGGGPEFKLLPVSRDTFALKDYGRFRLRFNLNKDGRIDSVTGIYIEGRQDKSDRTDLTNQ